MIPRARIAAAFAALLAAASLLGACSLSDTLDQLSKAQYLAQLQTAFKQLTKEKDLPKKLIQADSGKQRKALVNDAVGRFDATVAELEEIEPPDKVKVLNDRLVDVMQGFSSLFNKANTAIQTGDVNALLELPEEASALGQETQSLSQDFTAAGYEVAPPKTPDPQGFAASPK